MKIAVFTSGIGASTKALNNIGPIGEYAAVISAQYIPILENPFPEFGNGYAKMAIHKLGEGFDWCIWIDPKVALCEMMNMAKECPQDKVGHWGGYGADSWFTMDDVFKADTHEVTEPGPIDSVCEHCGSEIASQKTVTVTRPRAVAFDDAIICVPAACHEVWRPTELGYRNALALARRPDFMAQWCLARNVAANRFALHQFQSPARKAGAQHDGDCFVRLKE